MKGRIRKVKLLDATVFKRLLQQEKESCKLANDGSSAFSPKQLWIKSKTTLNACQADAKAKKRYKTPINGRQEPRGILNLTENSERPQT